MTIFRDFVKWYNKDVDQKLEVMQKMTDLYHKKKIDTL